MVGMLMVTVGVQGEPPTGAVVRTFKDLVTGEVIGFETTKYNGEYTFK